MRNPRFEDTPVHFENAGRRYARVTTAAKEGSQGLMFCDSRISKRQFSAANLIEDRKHHTVNVMLLLALHQFICDLFGQIVLYPWTSQ
jgi:hypothetical protein